MAEPAAEGQIGDGDALDAEVVPIRKDTSCEHPLDEPDDDMGEAVPVHDGPGIALPAVHGERRKIIPAHYRTWKSARTHVGKRALDIAHPAAFHAVRLFWYLLLAGWWAGVGLVQLAKRQLSWWWQPEHQVLASVAVVAGSGKEYRQQVNHTRKVRGERGLVLLGELIVVVGVLVSMLIYSPWWGWAALAAVAVPSLARYGRPAHLPIIAPPMTTPRVRLISAT
jgi:DNA segregation ATPase FtsK/SpoIIIE, S-DNA-T family